MDWTPKRPPQIQAEPRQWFQSVAFHELNAIADPVPVGIRARDFQRRARTVSRDQPRLWQMDRKRYRYTARARPDIDDERGCFFPSITCEFDHPLNEKLSLVWESIRL